MPTPSSPAPPVSSPHRIAPGNGWGRIITIATTTASAGAGLLLVTLAIVIQGDAERLHQVASSLLSNVRVHTPPGTEVEVEVSDEGDPVVTNVTDDGPGIPTAAIGQIFNRFFRVDPSRSRRSGGRGLGLAIVDAIVTAHHGRVSASNVTARALASRSIFPLPVTPPSRSSRRRERSRDDDRGNLGMRYAGPARRPE